MTAHPLQEQGFRQLLDAAPDAMVVVDPGASVVALNREAERLFGWAEGEVLGQPLSWFIPARFQHVPDAQVTDDESRRTLPKHAPVSLFARRRDGSEFPVEISLSHVETPEGTLAMAFVTDITERVEMQRAARQSEKLAALGTLAAGIAHEINNPLGIISSRVELMLLEAESEPLPPAAVDDLKTVHRHAERVARIAQGLLSFSRQSSTELGPVDLNAVVEDTVLLARGQIEKSGVAVRVALAPCLPPLRGSAGALGQVVLNLLNNARDASGQGGEIVVTSALAPGDPASVELVVADHGHGMDADTLARIFDPFYTTKSTGTGLGLSISYGIVRDHGGTITPESTPGEGSRFVVRLPLA